jgi:opacity protein-like surface antigen
MQALRLVASAIVLTTLTAVPARADGFITPFYGYNFGGDSSNCASLRNCEDKRTNIGVSFGSSHGLFGVEEDISYAKDFFGKTPGAANSVLTAMSNLMFVIPAGPIQPYGIIGVGLIRPHAKLDSSALSITSNALGWDIGAGLNIFLGHTVGVRGDVRRMKTLSDVTLGIFAPSAKLEFWRGSVGLTLRF